MRLPRDVSGDDLAKALADLGYRVTRQTGSHLRLEAGTPRVHRVRTRCAGSGRGPLGDEQRTRVGLRGLRHAHHAREDEDYDWAAFACHQAAEKAIIVLTAAVTPPRDRIPDLLPGAFPVGGDAVRASRWRYRRGTERSR